MKYHLLKTSVYKDYSCDGTGVPGVFDRTKKALFEAVTNTIGFDDDRIQLKEHSEILKGDFLDHYEFSFQLSGLSDCKMSGGIWFTWIKITM